MTEENNNSEFDFDFEGMEDLKPLEEVVDDTPAEEPEDINTEEKKKEEVVDEDKSEGKEVTPSTEDTNKKDTDNNSSSNNNVLSSIVEILQEDGVLKLEEDEKIESAEDFLKVIDGVKNTALEAETAEWTDHQKEYFEAIRNGIPHEQIVQHQQKQQSFESITDDVLEGEEEDNVNLRKQVIIAGFKARGFDDKKATRYAEQSVKEGTDLEDAKDFRDELREADKKAFEEQLENNKKEQLEQKKLAEKQKKEFRDFINTTKEIIPDMPLTTKERKTIMDGVTKPVYTDENTGQQYNRLGDFIRREGQKGVAKLVYILEKTKDFENADIISSKKASKSTTKKLDDVLRTTANNQNFAKDNGTEAEKTLDDLLKSPAFD